MLSLLVSLGLLGLAAVDPVGIAVMPLLLTQTDGIRRGVWFLIGSAIGITALGVLSTAAFYWVGQGEWMIATVLFTLGSIGFQAGTSFYDSLIVNVASA